MFDQLKDLQTIEKTIAALCVSRPLNPDKVVVKIVVL
jgi:hypothetical protein